MSIFSCIPQQYYAATRVSSGIVLFTAGRRLKALCMKISNALLQKWGKKYEPSSMVTIEFKGKDLSLKTDSDGNPVVMFIGTLQRHGRIKGERYVRTLLNDTSGKAIKDHWDFKGKS